MRAILAGALALFLLFSACARAETVAFVYAASDEQLTNPFIGNAVWANDPSPRAQAFTLVYANLSWAELEKTEGAFDFDAFEAENYFDDWRAQGKKLILRFVMDIPGAKKHRDIPDWLYKKTMDGKDYSVSYGKGYCPDYNNPIVIEAHARAVAAIGQRYGADSFVAFVQLGSLGHWGEWHVHKNAGAMPDEAVRDRYAAPYLDAFPHAKLMMRRPFAFARANGLGLYNDASGNAQPTETWLRWIENGGEYDQTGEENALSPMPDAWKTAPVGGELTTEVAVTRLLTRELEQTLSLYARSHASWIGPHSFIGDTPLDEACQAAYDRVNGVLGYRLRMRRAALMVKDGRASLSVTLTNDGCAPFYFDWTPCVRLSYANGQADVYPLELRLLDVLPGAEITSSVSLGQITDACAVEFGILDPDTKMPGVALAMDAPSKDLWYLLMELTP